MHDEVVAWAEVLGVEGVSVGWSRAETGGVVTGWIGR